METALIRRVAFITALVGACITCAVQAQDNGSMSNSFQAVPNQNNASSTTVEELPPDKVGDNPASEHTLPPGLASWQDWATWDDIYRSSPRAFNNGNVPLPFWPSQLNLQATTFGATFQFSVDVRHRVWVNLPGDERIWPENVTVDGNRVPILRRGSTPALQLEAGKHLISGSFSWPELPPRLALPREIGILALTLNGKPVSVPTWGDDGYLIFQQAAPPASEKDFLEVKVYNLLQDGLPLNLETVVQLSVSGKSREETLGGLLPAGWKLSDVESGIPIAIDEQGNAKMQVRAGRWVISLSAFTLDPRAAIGYAPNVHPAVPEELVGFRSQPDFRVAKVSDLNPVDVTQTEYPTTWGNRDFPVYRWTTSQPFHLEETMRGIGQKNRSGLSIQRQIWLDERGKGLTYLDSITGTAQERWRLDAAQDNDLGAVVQGNAQDGSPTGLLITKNPETSALGVELRSSIISLVATGMIHTPGDFSATGWSADTDALSGSLDLPPGWRLIAMLGPDTVDGDWLTAWTLLDLFFLLIFTLVVWRVWGWKAGLVALIYYTLAYHEPNTPRILWLALLPPIILLRHVKSGIARAWLNTWKWLTLIVFVVVGFGFVSSEITSALYPQLESTVPYKRREIMDAIPYNSLQGNYDSAYYGQVTPGVQQQQKRLANLPFPTPVPQSARPSFALPADSDASMTAGSAGTAMPQGGTIRGSGFPNKINLAQDDKAKVQTGPAIPQRFWRRISFSWSGPVTPGERVRLFLIPPILERLFDLIRVALFIALAAILLGWKQIYWTRFTSNSVQRVVISTGLAFIFIPSLHAQQEDAVSDTRLNQLRARIYTLSTAYPNAAEIASAALSIHGETLTTKLVIHAAIETAVPLPGRLPTWSPVSVVLDGHPQVALRRMNGYLWIIVPAGIHQVEYVGMIPQASDWSWSYDVLKPHKLSIDAPEWTWTGLLPDSSVEDQIFFSRKVAKTAQSDYGSQQLSTLVQLERNIEFGQVWQIHNSVHRLTGNNSATSIRLKLLPNERVLSAVLVPHDGFLDVPLAATQAEISWDSELPKSDSLHLSTSKDATWVERWTMNVSPIWDVKNTGIEPTFDSSDQNLVPIWRPWPGEKVELTIARPEAVAGNTLTIGGLKYEGTLGLREMTCNLHVDLKCSVGQDFYLDLPREAVITNLIVDGLLYPVHFEPASSTSATTQRLAVPLQPNSFQVLVQWKAPHATESSAELPEITFLHSEDNRLKKVGVANSLLSLAVPQSRVILWTWGPAQGPAVTLWVTLAVGLLAAYLLSRAPLSPLGVTSWFLIMVGLSQERSWLLFIIPFAWFFLLAWRGRESFLQNKWMSGGWLHNFFQIFLIVLTFIFVGISLSMVSAGLLGGPQMWIYGNNPDDQGSNSLAWFSSSAGSTPHAGFISVSIWWYRLAMLLWSLWLANAALKWLKWAFLQMTKGGFFRPLKWPQRRRKLPTNLPPTPPVAV